MQPSASRRLAHVQPPGKKNVRKKKLRERCAVRLSADLGERLTVLSTSVQHVVGWPGLVLHELRWALFGERTDLLPPPNNTENHRDVPEAETVKLRTSNVATSATSHQYMDTSSEAWKNLSQQHRPHEQVQTCPIPRSHNEGGAGACQPGMLARHN